MNGSFAFSVISSLRIVTGLLQFQITFFYVTHLFWHFYFRAFCFLLSSALICTFQSLRLFFFVPSLVVRFNLSLTRPKNRWNFRFLLVFILSQAIFHFGNGIFQHVIICSLSSSRILCLNQDTVLLKFGDISVLLINFIPADLHLRSIWNNFWEPKDL